MHPATAKRVLARYRTSEETVDKIGEAFGVTGRTIARAVKGQARRMPLDGPELVAKAGRLYRTGLGLPAVGFHLGVGERRARSLVVKAGVPIRPRGWPERLHFGKRIA